MATAPTTPKKDESGGDFIREIIKRDVQNGKHGGRVATRFPPEPNGYLHIGHAKSICLNFGSALQYPGGECHLRMDDTNPTTEDPEYVEAIQDDVRWLGFDWGDNMFYASDYFDELYEYAEQLIRSGHAYVCSLNEDEMRAFRGSVTEPGKESPYRARSVDESLDLFRRMRAGEFPDGAHTLRARIDMSNPNMKMRDPPLYRIRHAHHYRTGDAWCIYPLYDYTHCLSDSIEGITHSICTLEFENNRELYDWVLAAAATECRPQQIEFARLNLTYTVLSKRRLLALVEGKYVSGWDDPRMPTIAGLRRRGYRAEGIRAFCDRIGVSKNNSTVDVELLEHHIREDLNQCAPRVLCVLSPLKVVVENIEPGKVIELDAPYFPPDVAKPGSRRLKLSREVYIEREDFQEQPHAKFFRLAPGREVRLRYACVVKCNEVIKNDAGEVVELRVSYDPDTLGGGDPAGRKVRGTIHWVSAAHAVDTEVRLYDRLFIKEFPGDQGDFLKDLNPESLQVVSGAKLEEGVIGGELGVHFQFERHGFFCLDTDGSSGKPAFNRTVALRDSWAKIQEKDRPKAAAPAKPKPSVKAPDAAARRAPLTPQAAVLLERHGLGEDEARVLSGDAALQAFFEAALSAHPAPRTIANLLVNELGRTLKEKSPGELGFPPEALGELAALLDEGKLTSALGKEVLKEMLASGKRPAAVVAERGLSQIDDRSQLGEIVKSVIADNPDPVARFKSGNANVLGALVGMVMRETRGKANPRLVDELLREQLG